MSAIKIYPVVHVYTFEQAVFAGHQALNEPGTQGAFIMSLHGEDELALEVATMLQQVYPNKTVGVNLLYTDHLTAIGLAVAASLKAIWFDNVGITSSGATPITHDILQTNNNQLEIFGSVAFKYATVDPNPPEAARIARELGMIPVTSGPATGHPPTVHKVQAMSYSTIQALQPLNLGIASGMAPNNISDFAPYLSHVLVATGILASDGETFDIPKLQRLIYNANHPFNPQQCT